VHNNAWCVWLPIFADMIKWYYLLALQLFSASFLPAARAQGIFDSTIKPAAADVAAYVPLLKHKRVALVMNQTSEVGGKLLLDILLKKKVKVVRIFTPEHGFRGTEDAGAHVENSRDRETGLPVISLYGSNKKPKDSFLRDIDVLVYDLQDVGVRFYTYISTLEYCMEACAQNHKQLLVLDRPNPNGFYIDGPVLEQEQKSFVGMQRIPVVYGMTAGEYAQMLKGEHWVAGADSLDLQVIKCLNYDHSKKYKVPVAPSPNLRTMEAIYAYPALCFFEGTPISVGRGTDKPFQQYGCPELAGYFDYSFTPESMPGAKAPPHMDKVCYGELVGNTPAEVLQKMSGRLNLMWLLKAYNVYPAKDKFFTPFFAKLAGTSKLAVAIKRGEGENLIRNSWQEDLELFRAIRQKYLLYTDF